MACSWKASRLLAAGFVAGVLVGTAGISAAALGKKGWDRFTRDFKEGYVHGFMDATRLAKTYDPRSYLATQYRIPLKAGTLSWVGTLNDLYTKPEHQQRTVWQLMAVAGPVLEKHYGPEVSGTPGAAQLAALRAALERADEVEAERAQDKRAEPQLQQPPATGNPAGADAKQRAGDKAAPGSDQIASAKSPADDKPAVRELEGVGNDAPGVKQRRRACFRQCAAKAEAERSAYRASRAAAGAGARGGAGGTQALTGGTGVPQPSSGGAKLPGSSSAAKGASPGGSAPGSPE